jgi:hypothetical protein
MMPDFHHDHPRQTASATSTITAPTATQRNRFSSGRAGGVGQSEGDPSRAEQTGVPSRRFFDTRARHSDAPMRELWSAADAL